MKKDVLERLPDIPDEGKLNYRNVNKLFNYTLAILSGLLVLLIGFIYLLSKGVF